MEIPGDAGLSDATLDVVHADAHLLVLNKPAGLLSVPGRGPDKQDCLSARAQQVYADARVVHRLDMATSGLLVMARGETALSQLGKAFAQRQVLKHYLAVVQGQPDAQPGPDGWSTIDLPMRLDWPNRPLSIVDPAGGKPSLTRWRLLAHDRASNTSTLLLQPVTGRSHQLRVHLKALGHPILGDALYAPAPVQAMAARLLLHACALSLRHPHGGEPLQFSRPAPFAPGISLRNLVDEGAL